MVTNPGTRTDLHGLLDMIKAGKNVSDIAGSNPEAFFKYPRAIVLLMANQPLALRDPLQVILLYGPTGCGKTRFVYDQIDLNDFWPSGADGFQWFDGYHGQTDVLFDDFDGKMSKVSLAKTLRLTDRYPLMVPVKGGYTPFKPRRLFITSNIHPSNWFDFSERQAQYAALYRRISVVFHYKTTSLVIPPVKYLLESPQHTNFFNKKFISTLQSLGLGNVAIHTPDPFDFTPATSLVPFL